MMLPMGLAPYEDEVALAQALVRAYSPSGGESVAAEVLLSGLEALGYQTEVDDAGNVIGTLSSGDGPAVMLNGHLDTVAVGDEAAWDHPPLSGAVVGGELWGRGSVDMKAALACMAFAGRDAVNDGFKGSVIVTGVVQEEVGGLGARHLAGGASADVIVVGEPSDLKLMLGHRGRVELLVTIPGRIAHAARADLGDNALYRSAEFMLALRTLELPAGGALGASSLTPSRLRTFPESVNVVPGAAELTIDYRTIPTDEPSAIVKRIGEISREVSVTIPFEEAVSENGKVHLRFPRVNPSYVIGDGHWVVGRARQILKGVLEKRGLRQLEGYWWFATDAPYLAQTDAPVIGFGPGDPDLAHTTRERVPLEQLATAREGYAALVRHLVDRGS